MSTSATLRTHCSATSAATASFKAWRCRVPLVTFPRDPDTSCGFSFCCQDSFAKSDDSALRLEPQSRIWCAAVRMLAKFVRAPVID